MVNQRQPKILHPKTETDDVEMSLLDGCKLSPLLINITINGRLEVLMEHPTGTGIHLAEMTLCDSLTSQENMTKSTNQKTRKPENQKTRKPDLIYEK